MKKFIVHIIVREGKELRDVPLREFNSYEEAETARKAYEKQNLGSYFIIEHELGEKETNFQKITKSPEALGAFLASLPVLSGPWDDAFHRLICAGCGELDGCDECKKPERDNPAWWLGLIEEREETSV